MALERNGLIPLLRGPSSGDPRLEALAWEMLWRNVPPSKSRPAARDAFEREYSLRKSARDEDGLAITKEHLAELELAKSSSADYSLALRLIDEAFAAPSPTFKTSPQYYPIHVRAKILLKSGRKSEALSEFRRAVNSAGPMASRSFARRHDQYQTVSACMRHMPISPNWLPKCPCERARSHASPGGTRSPGRESRGQSSRAAHFGLGKAISAP